MRDSLQKETKYESSFLLCLFPILPGGSNEASITTVTQAFCLGSLKNSEVTVLLPLSVQVQYSGPGSTEAAGVC